LVLYVIRRIEETTSVEFRFSRPAPLFSLGGPMMRLAEAALLRLFLIADRVPSCLGLASPARHHTRAEIARTAELARRASRMSPAKWQSGLILAFTGDVRSELVGSQIMQEQQSASTPPRSRPMILVAERTLPEPPTSPPPSTGRTV